MARDRATRLREFEMMENRAMRRHAYDMEREESPYMTTRRHTRLGANTMAPPEEVLEHRRTCRRPVVMAAEANGARSALLENVIILLILIASIYGLYRLAIYLLNQG